METPYTLIEELYERGEEYGKNTLELAKLKVLEATTAIVTALIWRLSVFLVLSLFTLVLNVGIALWIGEILGKLYFGFFIVAGFYLIIGIVLHFFLYNQIKKPVSELIISQVLQ